MAKAKTPTVRQRRTEAENKVATLKAHAEAAVLEQTVKLLESPQPVVVPWSEYPAFDQFSQWPTGMERPYLWSSPEDRTEGRYRPYYETEQDLKISRAAGRRFKALFPVAESQLESLTNYVIKGLTIKIQPKKQYENADAVKQMARNVQKVVDRTMDQNDFIDGLDREIHENTREVGEEFVTLYPENNGRDVRIELTDPDFIAPPLYTRPLEQWLGCSHKLNHWWHGVHTHQNPMLKRDDVMRPLGYHAVFDTGGEQWDYLKVTRVQHIKRNVGRTARRGVSDFFIIQKDLEAEAKIRRNTAEGAAILAAIVMIREHAEGTSKSSIESMVSNNATSTVNKYTQNGIRTANQENVRPGTIKDNPHGMTSYLGPLGSLHSPVYIEVAKYIQQVMWARWNAPDYMSGDASGQNYATSLVSESPFVRAREADQGFYGGHYTGIIWKVLRMLSEYNALCEYSYQTVKECLDVIVDMASPASRDKEQQATTNEKLNNAGILSKRTWATESDLDYDEEQARIAVEPKTKKPEPVGFGSPFGMRPPFPPRQGSRLEALAAKALKRITEGGE
jgi:hypothetical protein